MAISWKMLIVARVLTFRRIVDFWVDEGQVDHVCCGCGREGSRQVT